MERFLFVSVGLFCRKSITNTLNALSLAEGAIIAEELSIGSAGSLADRQRQRKIQPWDNIDELSGEFLLDLSFLWFHMMIQFLNIMYVLEFMQECS